MTVFTFKNRLSLLMVLGHLGVLMLLVLVFLFFQGSFSGSELITSISIILPTFAAYATIALHYLGKNPVQNSANQREMNPMTTIVSFTVLGLALLFAILLIISRIMTNIDFEIYKSLLGLIEVIFGASIGQVMFSHFDLG